MLASCWWDLHHCYLLLYFVFFLLVSCVDCFKVRKGFELGSCFLTIYQTGIKYVIGLISAVLQSIFLMFFVAWHTNLYYLGLLLLAFWSVSTVFINAVNGCVFSLLYFNSVLPFVLLLRCFEWVTDIFLVLMSKWRFLRCAYQPSHKSHRNQVVKLAKMQKVWDDQQVYLLKISALINLRIRARGRICFWAIKREMVSISFK